MKRKFYKTIGEIKQGKYGLQGRINGNLVSLKEITDKETGETKWLVSELIEVWESLPKQDQEDAPF